LNEHFFRRHDAMTVQVTISDWLPAPWLDSGGEAVFAIGDTHGLTEHLTALRDTIGKAASEVATMRCRLVQLGDLVDGGPDSDGALNLVTGPGWRDGFAASHVLIGNHEILMRLCLEAANSAALSIVWRAWTGSGGDAALTSFGIAPQGEAEDVQPVLIEQQGARLTSLLQRFESHVLIGNLVLVHAGIDPADDAPALAQFLAKPWDELPLPRPGGDRHWAWIREKLLNWDGKAASGRLVVHGHTPEPKVKKRMGARYPGAHVLNELRLGLDGGSWRTGRVAAAQLEPGRYRIFLAEGEPR
jgi:serine/threonine protein phosphatase 1